MNKIIICATLLALACTQVAFGQSEDDENHVVCKDKPDGYFVDRPINCQAFWVCIAGVGYPGYCEPEYNFNEEFQLCDLPEHFACDPPTTIEPTQPTPTTDATEPTPPTSEPEPEPPFDCPPNGIHFSGKHGSCTKYNFCYSGNHTVRECVNGLHYNVERNACDLPTIANCAGRKCPLVNDADNLVTHHSANSCEEYSICYDGVPSPFKCPDNIHWNQAIQECDLPENAKCPNAPPPIQCPENDSFERVPHPTDCQKYYVCVQEESFLRTCPTGLLFDSVLKECNFVANVAC